MVMKLMKLLVLIGVLGGISAAPAATTCVSGTTMDLWTSCQVGNLVFSNFVFDELGTKNVPASSAADVTLTFVEGIGGVQLVFNSPTWNLAYIDKDLERHVHISYMVTVADNSIYLLDSVLPEWQVSSTGYKAEVDTYICVGGSFPNAEKGDCGGKAGGTRINREDPGGNGLIANLIPSQESVGVMMHIDLKAKKDSKSSVNSPAWAQNISFSFNDVEPIPEPITFSLMGLGLLGIAGVRSWRNWKNGK